MNPPIAHPIRIRNLQPARADIADDVCAGLRLRPRRVASKYFYDARGSQLFERICEQPEYYLTRVELSIMAQRIGEIAAALGEHVQLVEYGSGSGIKTRLLLRHLRDVAAYVPVELAGEALLACVHALRDEFPRLEIVPICADFTAPFAVPASTQERRTVVFFPGSTIGNFETREAIALLRQMRVMVGRDGGALIGADLKKDRGAIEAAYNDAAGVTAEFTLNMLRRFNREIGADFDLGAFRHRARYNALAGRIETHLVSTRGQDVHIGDETFRFEADEALLTEYSYKYSLEDFARMAGKAGFTVQQVWTDPERRFSLQYLT